MLHIEIEKNNYKVNLENFVAKLQSSCVTDIILDIDTNPTFELSFIPFKFDYAYQATVLTNKGSFKIYPSQNTFGDDTFWVEELNDEVIGDKIIDVNSGVLSVNIDTLNGFAFKLCIQFIDREIYIYCGEIHDNSIVNKNDIKYAVCDEMLLVFYNKADAIKFEELSNMGIYSKS